MNLMVPFSIKQGVLTRRSCTNPRSTTIVSLETAGMYTKQLPDYSAFSRIESVSLHQTTRMAAKTQPERKYERVMRHR